VKIATIVSPGDIHVGSTVGAISLCLNSGVFVPFSTVVLGGKPGFVEVEVGENLEMIYPQRSIADGLEAFDPDGVLIFTLTNEVYNALDNDIVEKYPTAWRCNTSFIEFFIRPDTRDSLFAISQMPAKVDAVVCATEKVKKDLNALGWKNTTVIPSAVDVSKFEKAEPNGDLVVSIGRMNSIKNLATSILAMSSVIQRNPSARYEIYGKGELSNYVNDLIEKFKFDRISYEGYEESEEVLKRAKVFLQMSLSENQSLAPIEAQAAGVPVVCSSIDGHPSSALRVPHDSIHDVANAVERLLSDDELYESKREEGLEEVKTHDVERIAPMYEDLFRKLRNLRGDFKK